MFKDLTLASDKLKIINFVLLAALAILLAANGIFLSQTKTKLGLNNRGLFDRLSPLAFFTGSGGGNIKLSGNLGEDAVKLALAGGVPEGYGQELNIDFDQV